MWKVSTTAPTSRLGLDFFIQLFYTAKIFHLLINCLSYDHVVDFVVSASEVHLEPTPGSDP